MLYKWHLFVNIDVIFYDSTMCFNAAVYVQPILYILKFLFLDSRNLNSMDGIYGSYDRPESEQTPRKFIRFRSNLVRQCEHLKPDVPQTFKVKVKGQGHSVT